MRGLAAPPSPGPLAGGPGLRRTGLAGGQAGGLRARAGPKGRSRIADLVAERSPVAAAEPATGAHLDPHRWHQEGAAPDLRERLAQLIGDVGYYVAVLAEYLDYTDRHRMIAAALQDADRRAEATSTRPDEGLAARPRDLLVSLLVEVGEQVVAVAERRTDFERRPIAAAFQALHATVTRACLEPAPVTDWALDLLRTRVAENPRLAPHLVAVLLPDHRRDEAWSVVATHADLAGGGADFTHRSSSL